MKLLHIWNPSGKNVNKHISELTSSKNKDYTTDSKKLTEGTKETKKLGYMNPKFKIIIPCKFDEAGSFVGKYAVVKLEDRDAIIDKKGNIYFSDDLR